jgi:hypothetical protein
LLFICLFIRLITPSIAHAAWFTCIHDFKESELKAFGKAISLTSETKIGSLLKNDEWLKSTVCLFQKK